MKLTRPVNLNLFTIQFPLPAKVSLFHRISGFALFILIPVGLWLFSQSLTDSGYDMLREWKSQFYVKLIFWILLMPFCYHLVAGLRHLLMDLHIGATLKGGRQSAWLTLIFSFLLIILTGIWLW